MAKFRFRKIKKMNKIKHYGKPGMPQAKFFLECGHVVVRKYFNYFSSEKKFIKYHTCRCYQCAKEEK